MSSAVARRLYRRVARLGFKRHATAVLNSNLIQSIEFGTAVARLLKRAVFRCLARDRESPERGNFTNVLGQRS